VRRAFVAGTAAIGTALFAYSIDTIGAARIYETVGRIGWSFSAILLLSGAREMVRAAAWTRSVEGPGRLPFLDALRARLAGEALNTLLPMGMIVGEPAKVEHVGHRLPLATAVSALALEFAFYTLSLVLLFSAGLVALFPPSSALFMVIGVLMAVPHVRGRTRRASIAGPARVSEDGRVAAVITRAFRRLSRLGDPVLGFGARHPGSAWHIFALESAYHILGIVEVYLTLRLLSPGHVPWTSAVVLETVNRAVTMVFKVLPMRMGVDEAGSAMFANRLDLGASTGVMLALVRKMRLLFWSAVGLVFLLARSAERSVTPADVELSSART
jgi:hypothetical protein